MSIEQFILDNEVTIRLLCFAGIFLIMAIWEVHSPRRKLLHPKLKRWMGNIGITVINTLLLRFLFPAAAVGVATYTQQNGGGLLPLINLPVPVLTVIAVILLDLAIYLQHVMVHAVPLLWRLHRVHHADLDYDVTTGARFHPVEIILSMFIKFSVIVLLGPPIVAVVLFEIILNATALFNHSNVKLPITIDRLVRTLIVTPDMHRVHHSVLDDETNSNFGFSLAIWDRLFGTYKAQPDKGHEAMDIGIDHYREFNQTNRLLGMLLLPLQKHSHSYTINRRTWNKKR